MAINETIASGKYRQCIDEINKIWKRYSLWNKASDTECEDGQTVEEKVGTIKGITTDENVTESGYAADMIALNELRAQLYSDIEKVCNRLSALDTRVTNAITGGFLAAPYSYNVLNYPYSEGGIDGQNNAMQIKATSATSAQIYGAAGGGTTVSYWRQWSNSFKITGRPTVSWNTSYASNGNLLSSTLQVLEASTGAILLQTSNNASLDLSSLQGKNVKFKQVFTMDWIGTFTFSKLLLVNK